MTPGGPQDTWRVEAYDHWEIPNSSALDPSPAALAHEREVRRLQMAAAVELRPPTGRYNCFGLVFASRRTNIPSVDPYEEVDIHELLARDGYRRVSSAQVGDIAVYAHDREIDHAGFVSRVDPLGPVVFVWSKWGQLGEFEHRAHIGPYTDCAIEYWRLAP